MSDNREEITYEFTIPSESTRARADEILASDSEDARAVAKALLDFGEQAELAMKAITGQIEGQFDFSPYLDFWFADAVEAANRLETSENPGERDLATTLVQQEQSMIRTKVAFLQMIKRLAEDAP